MGTSKGQFYLGFKFLLDFIKFFVDICFNFNCMCGAFVIGYIWPYTELKWIDYENCFSETQGI